MTLALWTIFSHFCCLYLSLLHTCIRFGCVLYFTSSAFQFVPPVEEKELQCVTPAREEKEQAADEEVQESPINEEHVS